MPFESLFSKWKQGHAIKAFISDGIVDPSSYEDPHILFVLRDMNCDKENDLCRDLREHGSGGDTWCNVGRWIVALLDGADDYPRDMSNQKRAAQLRRVAVMNLKKEGGGSRAKGNELEAAVSAQKELILEEIQLCAPALIIACGLSSAGMDGNATLLHKYVFGGIPKWKTLKSEELDREWWYFVADINGNEVPVISFCHPQVTVLHKRRGHDALFEPLYRDMLYIRALFQNGELS